MNVPYLDTPVEFLKGVGPQRAELLRKDLGIFTFRDLVNHFPFRYVDRTKFYTVSEISTEMPYIQLKGQIKNLVVKGEKRKKHLAGRFEDETGSIELKWFQGLKWVTGNLKLNTDYILFGRPSEFNGYINIIHPELEPLSESDQTTSSVMQPVYSTTEKLKARGIDSRSILRFQKQLISHLPPVLPETLPGELISSIKLLPLSEAYASMHFPSSLQRQKLAEFRFKFEELFFLQLRLLHSKLLRLEKFRGFAFNSVGDAFNEFYHNHLPFPLTNAQKKSHQGNPP
jgi:ATP-dependent DNA helicase RecG